MGPARCCSCPTLQCHIRFGRNSVASTLVCKVLLNCCDYLGALQRRLILRAEDAALQTDSNWVGGKCRSEWVSASFNPLRRNAPDLKIKRWRRDCQVDKRCSAIFALLCQTFSPPFSIRFDQSACAFTSHTHWRAPARKSKDRLGKIQHAHRLWFLIIKHLETEWATKSAKSYISRAALFLFSFFSILHDVKP